MPNFLSERFKLRIRQAIEEFSRAEKEIDTLELTFIDQITEQMTLESVTPEMFISWLTEALPKVKVEDTFLGLFSYRRATRLVTYLEAALKENPLSKLHQEEIAHLRYVVMATEGLERHDLVRDLVKTKVSLAETRATLSSQLFEFRRHLEEEESISEASTEQARRIYFLEHENAELKARTEALESQVRELVQTLKGMLVHAPSVSSGASGTPSSSCSLPLESTLFFERGRG